jgi:hypothetical protein
MIRGILGGKVPLMMFAPDAGEAPARSESSDTARGVSQGTVLSEEEALEQDQPSKGSTAFQDVLTKLVKDDNLGELSGTQAEQSEDTSTEPVQTEEEENETEAEQEETPAEGEESEELKPAAEKPSIEEQIEEAKAKGEKPKWYLSRIADESASKRRERDARVRAEDLVAERDRRIAELEQQVATASGPRPTPHNQFPDVYDVAKLDQLEASYEELLPKAEDAITEMVSSGQESLELTIGTNPDGSEKTRAFTLQQLKDIKRNSDYALRKGIPARRAYLEQRKVYDDQAKNGLYEEFKDPESDFSQLKAQILRNNPGLEQMLGPSLLLEIGRYFRGLQWEAAMQAQKQGGNSTTKNEGANRIVQSAKQKIAPTTPKTRSLPERRGGADLVAKATKDLEETGNAEAAEQLVNAIFSRRRQVNKVVPAGS